mmetsp:Transcript_39037/g.98387  ORF Transcript_39037/g.98387 Transcript_39037/m.98387 type:complete len:203 (+) Transcript_39037:356-964(+)
MVMKIHKYQMCNGDASEFGLIVRSWFGELVCVCVCVAAPHHLRSFMNAPRGFLARSASAAFLISNSLKNSRVFRKGDAPAPSDISRKPNRSSVSALPLYLAISLRTSIRFLCFPSLSYILTISSALRSPLRSSSKMMNSSRIFFTSSSFESGLACMYRAIWSSSRPPTDWIVCFSTFPPCTPKRDLTALMSSTRLKSDVMVA